MSRLLLATTPAQGHTAPMLAVARHLVGRGHEVVFLTTAHYAERVTGTGARFVALRPEADAHDLLVSNPERESSSRRGLRGVKDDLRRVFIDPAPHQYRDVRQILSGFPADAVIVDTTFVGIAPLVVGRTAGAAGPVSGAHPAVVMLGVLPLPISSRDTAPFGLAMPPRGGVLGQARNVLLTWLTQQVALRDVQRYAQAMLASEGCPPIERFIVDAPAYLADAYLQLTTESFEYPRRDLPPTVRFIGPILADPTPSFHEPPWWGDLDQSRPVVHVTQGTIDNYDLGRLVLPTIDGLAHDDVLVVATTGGPDPASVPGQLPANARLERFVPHDRLLPRVDVMVTNGGYGGVQQALALGVPLVVAGDSEDKPEVAARVAWSGTGVDLRSGRPAPARIAAAVRQVLADPSFAERARTMQEEMGAHRPLEELDEVLDSLGLRARA
ncbi:MAG: glycosyltransferase [Acidimicrobiales bacterium]